MKSSASEPGLTQRVFLAKKVKNISEMEWNSFVCFAVNKENGREPAKQQPKPAILLKFTHFQLCIEKKQLRLLVVLGLPHILTVIYVFNKRFY